MLLDATYPAAFLVGLLGGVHCIGMCGGVMGALILGAGGMPHPHPVRMLPLVLAYNTGRILSYTVVGTLMGSMGYLATHLVAVNQVQRALQVLASLFMIALGLYLGGWWGGPVRLEQLGTIFWRHLQPLGRRLLPVHAPPQAFLLGMLWGWLPCGLVYSVLIWTIATGSAVQGGLLMLSFGLGTLPTLLAVGVFYAWLSTALRKVWVRRGAGMLVMIFGIYRLLLGAAV